MQELVVRVTREPESEGLPLPSYATAGSAALDLFAAVSESFAIAPGERRLVSTGLRIEIPEGFEAQIRPRSGWAVRDGLTVINSPGTVDSDYRGIVQVALVNLGSASVQVSRGDRIAQFVICPVMRVRWSECEALTETTRQGGGFGHSGR